MQKRQLKVAEKSKRGRKPGEPIVSNGLYESQWDAIQAEAKKEGIDAAVLLRRIVNWYYTAKAQNAERQEASYSHEENFKKLPKKFKEK